MSQPDDDSVENQDRSGFGEMLNEALTLQHLIDTGQLVTDEDLLDAAEGDEPELDGVSEEDAARSAALARLVIEANRQAAPPGAA